VVPVVPQLGVLLISEVLAVKSVERLGWVRLRLSRSRRVDEILPAHQDTQAAGEYEDDD
jgi:hypothetical protein